MGHPHGTFGWVDLSAADQDRAEEFYTGLFGLESRHEPIDGGGHYVMLTKGGKSVAGIGTKQSDAAPAAWQSYISVDDIDSVVEKVPGLGGQVIAPAFDVMTSGRMAVIADPTGAVVSLWQAGDHAGGEVFNEHGTHTWNELPTWDVGAAKDFYGQLVGWTYEEVDMGEAGTYHVALVDGKGEDPTNAGIFDAAGVFPDETPSHWDVYFNVRDTDAAAAKAAEMGGSVVAGPMDAPFGRFAYLADPDGAVFYVMAPPEG